LPRLFAKTNSLRRHFYTRKTRQKKKKQKAATTTTKTKKPAYEIEIPARGYGGDTQ